MQSIFRYPGGKSKAEIQKWILSHKPRGVKEYREPFVGGGGIFFGLPASSVGKRWINDKHDGLVDVYESLLRRPEEFIAACRAIEPAKADDPLTEEGPRGGKPTNARLKAEFERMKLNERCDQALRYYFVNRTVHGSGRVNYDIPSRLYFSNPDGWNIVATKVLEEAAEHMAACPTRVTSGDYEELFTFQGENVWIYADPPYVVNGNLSRTSQLYQHSFNLDDHKRFAEVVANCEHKVCVSYDDDGEGIVRSLFPESAGFRFVEATWRYCGTTNEEKEHGKELLILNYDPNECESVVVAPESLQLSAPLSMSEVDEIERLEVVVFQHIKSFILAGEALKSIRDSGRPSRRLYRQSHSTFKGYCLDQFGMSEVHANRLILAYERYEALKTKPIGLVLPERESVVRELCRIKDHDESASVLEQVLKSVENDPRQITAAVVRQHVNEHLGVEPQEPDHLERAKKALAKLTVEQLRLLFSEFLGEAEQAA